MKAAQVVLLVVVMVVLAMTIYRMVPRTEQSSPTGSDRSAPTEQPHYNFPTYA